KRRPRQRRRSQKRIPIWMTRFRGEDWQVERLAGGCWLTSTRSFAGRAPGQARRSERQAYHTQGRLFQTAASACTPARAIAMGNLAADLARRSLDQAALSL